jgi:hypothetical protein
MQKWTTWLGVPLAGVLAIVLAHWSLSATAAAPAEQPQAPPAATPAAQTYVLEVIGLGVSLDKHRQGKLWDALQKGHPFATIREMDPNKYPYSSSDKLGYEGAPPPPPGERRRRPADVLGRPSFYASGPFTIRTPGLRPDPPSESWVAPTATACR